MKRSPNDDGLGRLRWLFIPILFVVFRFLVWPVRNALVVIMALGWDAYEDGVCVVDAKQGTLSTGQSLPAFWDISTAFAAFAVTAGIVLIIHYLFRLVCGDARRREPV